MEKQAEPVPVRGKKSKNKKIKDKYKDQDEVCLLVAFVTELM